MGEMWVEFSKATQSGLEYRTRWLKPAVVGNSSDIQRREGSGWRCCERGDDGAALWLRVISQIVQLKFLDDG